MARVITGKTYPYRFATPRSDAYDAFERVSFAPLGRLIPKVKTARALNAVGLPMTWGKADLVHTFNIVPVTPLPFIVSFEGELPRSMVKGPKAARIRKMLRRFYTAKRCKGLYPISQFALRLLKYYAKDWSDITSDAFAPPVIYPSIPLRGGPKKRGDKLVLTFVGAEWARKGGAVCARVAALLRRKNIPFEMNVVSSMTVGLEVYTDTEASFYDGDLRSLSADDIIVHGPMGNADVLRLMDRSSLTMLPTLDDSFGYSVLESMAGGTPCVVTSICALPEVVDDGVDGIVVDLPKHANGRWAHIYTELPERRGDAFKDILDTTFNQLAAEICARIEAMLDTGSYEELSAGAIDKIKTKFDADTAARTWHAVYDAALGRNH